MLIFYGPRSNAELLLHSGFVYDGNVHDRLAVRMGQWICLKVFPALAFYAYYMRLFVCIFFLLVSLCYYAFPPGPTQYNISVRSCHV